MHKYRTHTCSEITKKDSGKIVKLSGWIHRKRDHGNLLFFDLRDHFGLTQCVIEKDNKYLLITSQKPISLYKFKLPDLTSRVKSCIIIEIKKPNEPPFFKEYLSKVKINWDIF